MIAACLTMMLVFAQSDLPSVSIPYLVVSYSDRDSQIFEGKITNFVSKYILVFILFLLGLTKTKYLALMKVYFQTR
jgi:hypothetical protein